VITLRPLQAPQDQSAGTLAGPQPPWAKGWFWGVLALVVTIPFLVSSIPPLSDYPGHVSQFHIMLNLGRSPYLQKYYGFEWVFAGNLGVDLLVAIIGPLLGVEWGTWIIATMTPALMVLGVFSISRALHGRVQPCAFLALPFVYAGAFTWGFLNYDLAVALMFLMFALWIRSRNYSQSRFLIFASLSFCLWVCHAVGWGLFLLLVGGYELRRAIADRGWRLAAFSQTMLRILPLFPPALLSARMIHFSETPHPYTVVTPGLPSGLIAYKIFIFAGQIHDRVYALSVASILIIGGLYSFARYRGASVSPALAIPAAFVGLAAILLPPVVSGSALADYRVAPVAIMILLLSIRSDATSGGRFIVFSALALTGLRLTVTAFVWNEDAEAYRRHLFALESIPTGARILVLVPSDVPGVTDFEARPMGHLADFAVVRRDALVNTQWVNTGAISLQIKANSNTAYYADPSQNIAIDKVNQVLAATRAEQFDYAWVLGRYPAAPTPPNLIRAYADEETVLFQTVK